MAGLDKPTLTRRKLLGTIAGGLLLADPAKPRGDGSTPGNQTGTATEGSQGLGITWRSRPLRIRKLESFIIRHPADRHKSEDYFVEMHALGTTTGGVGLWDRLDTATPAGRKGHLRSLLVKITTDEGLVGWGEASAAMTPGFTRRSSRIFLRLCWSGKMPVMSNPCSRECTPRCGYGGTAAGTGSRPLPEWISGCGT